MSLTKESLQRMLDRNPLLTIRGKIGDFYVAENGKGKTVVTGTTSAGVFLYHRGL